MQRPVLILAALAGLLACQLEPNQGAEVKFTAGSNAPAEVFYVATATKGMNSSGEVINRSGNVFLTKIAIDYESRDVEIKIRTLDSRGRVSQECEQISMTDIDIGDPSVANYAGRTTSHRSGSTITAQITSRADPAGDSLSVGIWGTAKVNGKKASYRIARGDKKVTSGVSFSGQTAQPAHLSFEAWPTVTFDQRLEGLFAPEIVAKPMEEMDELTTMADASIEAIQPDYHSTTGLMTEDDIKEFKVSGKSYGLDEWKDIFDDAVCGGGSPSSSGGGYDATKTGN